MLTAEARLQHSMPEGAAGRQHGRRPEPRVVDAGWPVALAVFFELLLLPVEGFDVGAPGLAFGAIVIALIAGASLVPSRGVRVRGLSLATIGWLGFAAVAVVSLTWTGNLEYGAWKWGVFAVVGLLPALASRIVVAAGWPFSWRPLAIVGAGYLIVAVVVSGQVPEYPGRLTMPGGNPIWLARAAVIATFAIWLASGWGLRARLAFTVIGTHLVVSSGSRGPAVAAVLVAGLGWMVMLATSKRRVQGFGVAVAAVMAAGIGAALASSRPFPGEGELPRNRILTSLEAGVLAEDANVLSRWASLRAGAEAFAEQPLLGQGLGGLARQGEREYAHNILVEVAAELGVVGLVLFVSAAWAGWRARGGDRAGRLFLAFCALSALMSGDLATNAVLVAIGLAPPVGRWSGGG